MGVRISRKWTAVGLRVLLIGTILVLVGAVVFFVVRRSGRPPVVRPETKSLTEQKVDVSEGISFTKDTGGRNILKITADRSAMGPEGLVHWSGVRIEVRTRDGRLRFGVTAGEAIADDDWTRVAFQGDIVLDIEGVRVTGAAFDFDQKENLITSAVPVHFEGERFRGDCPRARYDVGAEKLLFSGGVSLLVSAWTNDPVPLVFFGGEMSYDKGARTGQLSGDVKVTHGLSLGRADTIDFAQFVDKPGFRLFEFRGGVTIDTEEDPADRPARVPESAPKAESVPIYDNDLILLQGGRRHMEAGVITMLPFPGEEWLHVIFLKDGGRLEVFSGDGRRTTFEAGELEFFYGPDGALQDFNLRRDVRILGEADKRARLIEAPKIDYNANQGDLVADGLGQSARTISGGREVRAEKMFLNLRTNNFRMVGDVRMVNLPQPDEKRDAGIFAPDQPVFMTGDESFYDAESRLFRLTGRKARLWQGRDSLEAEDVEMNEGTGDLTAKHGVRSVFFHRPKGKDRDERIEVTGDRLDRLARNNRVFYEQSCTLSVEAIVLKSGRLILEPAEEAGKFKRIFADGGRVTVFQAGKRAEGDQADYDLVEDQIVLTGRPFLEDKEKGLIRGGKLTFHPADGKISIENQDAERSTTIIKS